MPVYVLGKGLTAAVPIEGQYANFLRVGSNAVEFVLDFGQQVAEDPAAEIVVRVFTSPSMAKEFLRVLSDSIGNWEATYGPITAPEAHGERT